MPKTATLSCPKPAVARLAPADRAEQLQSEHEATTTAPVRKELGQFFTPASIARYMAGMLGPLPRRIRLLDPGAGVGILSAAVCERVAALRSPRIVEVHAYETDRRVIDRLSETAAACAEILHARGHSLDFRILREDFVRALGREPNGSGLFKGTGKFDVVVMNPPYFKLNKESEHARLVGEIVHGQPNIYALFMWIGANALADDGQMVAITPRSWCSGPYFRRFRQQIFDVASLEQVHLFESRREAFEEAGVLQENVISAFRRRAQSPEVRLTTSRGVDFGNSRTTRSLSVSRVIDNSHGDHVVCLPTSDLEIMVTEAVESWPDRFGTTGLKVSTGPVVTFRATEHLRFDETAGAPLFSVHNVRPFQTIWPVERRGKPVALAVSEGTEKLLVDNSNYVLLRRISAKEEARRLTASPVFAGQFKGPVLAFENHLNYVYHSSRALSKHEVVGIAAILNSRLLDIYFRTISGNTQVNATEIRSMPFPDLEAITLVGKAVARHLEGPPSEIERATLDALGINGDVRAQLTA